MYEKFYDLCSRIKRNLSSIGHDSNLISTLECNVRSKKQDVSSQIVSTVRNDELREIDIPSWYNGLSLVDAVYVELYGWGPVEEWVSGYPEIDTFIIQGENCFIIRDGRQKLMKQRASADFISRLEKSFFSDGDICRHLPAFTIERDYYGGGYVFNRNGSCEKSSVGIKKQDVAVQLWNMINEHGTGVDRIDSDIIESSTMLSTDSFDLKIKSGHKYKVTVERIDDADE